jgi:hypothetical protein
MVRGETSVVQLTLYPGYHLTGGGVDIGRSILAAL